MTRETIELDISKPNSNLQQVLLLRTQGNAILQRVRLKFIINLNNCNSINLLTKYIMQSTAIVVCRQV